MESVASVFHHLSSVPIDGRSLLAKEWNQFGWKSLAVLGPHHGQGWLAKIGHRCAFAKKFRIIKHLQLPASGEIAQKVGDQPLGAARQHGAAKNQPVRFGLLAQGLGDLFGDLSHVAQIQSTTRLRRGADTNERGLRTAQRFRAMFGGPQKPLLFPLGQKRIQPGLQNRRLTLVQIRHFLRMNINTDDVVALLSQTPGRYCAYVAQTKNADSHEA